MKTSPSSLKQHHQKLIKRLLYVALAVTGVAQLPAFAAKVPGIYYGIATESSEYCNAQVQGAKAVADSVNTKLTVLVSEFQGQKFLQDYGAIFSAGCKDCVAMMDPVSNAFTKAIVDRASRADAKVITFWNRPENIHPWDTDPQSWVAHISFDGVDSGYQNGMALCKAIGGKGGVLVLQGVADNPPTKQRFAGFQRAVKECPGMTILDNQYADWGQTKAQTIVRGQLAKYGDQVKGIFSENDLMALGALAALREKGLAGKVPVTGSDGQSDVLQLIKSGEMVSTMKVDGAALGAVSTALAYGVATGDIDLSKLTHAQRNFYLKQTLVTKANVDQFLDQKFDPARFTYQKLKSDMWTYSSGPITDSPSK
ncbi:sugar ABC transporter substrate-binding protein [Paraburkholderia sp. J41]|uniref:sugar ABC transporter substrate-binding protein n=1 Tax=Paraburkholderia sp. J41 TaxID=2805433 RepID=UPI002AC34C5B|nr:sugar ABC transporter substrate-binding protein [Paraburkholderia sp. J41]